MAESLNGGGTGGQGRPDPSAGDGRTGAPGTGDGGTGTPGDGGGGNAPDGAGGPGPVRRLLRVPRTRRIARALGRFATQWSPQKLIGATAVAVLGSAVPILLQALLSHPSDSGPPTAQTGPAAQPSCSGRTCKDLDPNSAQCFGDAVTLADREAPVRLQIRYSPKCRAGWARIQVAGVGDEVSVQGADGTRSVGLVRYGSDALTRMVPADRPGFRLTGCADADSSTGRQRWPHFCITATSHGVPSPSR